MSRPIRSRNMLSDIREGLHGGAGRRARLGVPLTADKAASDASDLWEEEPDLPFRRFGRITAVNEVLRQDDAVVTTDRARRRVPRVGRAHHRADHLVGVLR